MLTNVERTELWGGWSLVLPGKCHTTRNEDRSWSAWDASHVIDVSIIETSGRADGSAAPPEVMMGSDTRGEVHTLDGALARVFVDVAMTDTADGSQPVEWTRVHAGADNSGLIMSIGNPGSRDAAWHEQIWRSLRHTPPRRGLGRFFGRRQDS
jgi:hypothetical protein